MKLTENEKWELLEELRNGMAELRTMNERMIAEMQKQDTELRQIRRAVFGYADRMDFDEMFPDYAEFDFDMDETTEDEAMKSNPGLAAFLAENNKQGESNA